MSIGNVSEVDVRNGLIQSGYILMSCGKFEHRNSNPSSPLVALVVHTSCNRPLMYNPYLPNLFIIYLKEN